MILYDSIYSIKIVANIWKGHLSSNQGNANQNKTTHHFTYIIMVRKQLTILNVLKNMGR